jgi:hypothetical protein
MWRSRRQPSLHVPGVQPKPNAGPLAGVRAIRLTLCKTMARRVEPTRRRMGSVAVGDRSAGWHPGRCRDLQKTTPTPFPCAATDPPDRSQGFVSDSLRLHRRHLQRCASLSRVGSCHHPSAIVVSIRYYEINEPLAPPSWLPTDFDMGAGSDLGITLRRLLKKLSKLRCALYFRSQSHGRIASSRYAKDESRAS